MGVIKKRVDDYLYNSKGEEVEGAEKTIVSVPGIAYGGTRAKKHEFDLSEKGRKAHDREREKAMEATRQAWATYLKNIGFDVEKNTPQAKADKNDADDAQENADDSVESTESEDLTEEDLEAATNPSGFGSDNY